MPRKKRAIKMSHSDKTGKPVNLEKELQALFFKELQSKKQRKHYAKNKATTKTQPKAPKTSRKSNVKRPKKTEGKSLQKRIAKKSVSKDKIKIQKPTYSEGNKRFRKSTKDSRFISIKKPTRSSKQIDINFSGVRSVDKKLLLFDNYSDKALNNAQKRYRKPPAAVVISIVGKVEGETAINTKVSPVDFVVNVKNVKAYVHGIIEKMKSDYSEWLGMKKTQRNFIAKQRKGTSNELFTTDSISQISIKYIYTQFIGNEDE